MSADRVDVVIIGAGLAGSATAWALARRGRSAVVLEAFEPGHRRGSSHGSARIFRRAYPDPLYVRLTGAAGELWRQLEDQAGEKLLTLTGGIDFGATRDPRRLHEVLTSCGVPAELLEPEAAAEPASPAPTMIRSARVAMADRLPCDERCYAPSCWHPAGLVDAGRGLANDRGVDLV